MEKPRFANPYTRALQSSGKVLAGKLKVDCEQHKKRLAEMIRYEEGNEIGSVNLFLPDLCRLILVIHTNKFFQSCV